MHKRCIICQQPALYEIKDTNNYYCEEHAYEFFEDISLLQNIKKQDLSQVDELLQEPNP